MTNSTDVFWEIDGVSLQTLAWNIETWGGDREAPPAVRGSNVTVPYVPGQQWLRKTPDSRVITLGMWVVGANEDGSIPTSVTQRAMFEKNWHQLRNLFFKPRRQLVLKKRFRLFGDNTVYTAQALAEFAGGLNPSMNGELRAVFTVDLLLADPYFYGDPITLELDPENPEEEFMILGDDRTMDVEFDITGLTKRLRIANETHDVSFDYTNPLPAGQVAHIDVKDFDARHNIAGANTPASTFIDHSGDPFWFFLEPGVNKLGIAEMDVPTRGTVWTNLITNPSFETGAGSSTIRTNMMQNPGLVLSDSTTLAVYRTNYITNPMLATNTNGWTVQNAGVTKALDSSVYYSGPSSMKITTAGNPNDGVFSDPMALSDWAGKPIACAFYIKLPAGKQVVASLHHSMGLTIAGTTVSITGTGDWQRVDLPSGLVPASATGGPYVYIRSTVATPSFIFNIDNVSLERATSIGDIFGGGSTGGGKTYAWLGTANASASTASATLQTLVTNQALNPGFENGSAVSKVNQMPNPSMEIASGYQNLFPNPRLVDATDRANWLFQTDGSGGTFNGTYTATGGPNAAAPSFGTVTTAGTPNTGYVSFGPAKTPVSPGNWYTGFFYGKTSFAGTQRISVTWYDANGNYITDQDVTAAQAIASGVWQSVRGTFQAPSGAQYVSMRAKFSGFANTSQTASATAFMLIPVLGAAFEYPFDYFDGAASPMAEYVTNWSGVAHQSTSILREASQAGLTNLFLHGSMNAPKATKSVIRTNLIRNPRFGSNTTDWSVGAGSGTAAITRQTTGGPTDFYWDGASTFGRAQWSAQSTTFGEVIMNAGANVPVTPGTQYAASLYAKFSAAQSAVLYVDWYTSGNSLISSSNLNILSVSTTWNRFGFVATAPASAAYAVLRLRYTGTVPVGFQMDVGCAMLEASTFYINSYNWPYFDGASQWYGTGNGVPASKVLGTGDFSVAWTGTAQNSSSTLSGFDIWGLNGNGAVPVYGHADVLSLFPGGNAADYQWKNGQALVFSSNQTDSGYVSIMYDDAIAGGLLTPGKQYTVLLRYAIYGMGGSSVPAPTGTQEALVYQDNVNAAVQTRSTYYTQTNGALGGNPGAIQEIRLTFTVAATATSASIRFYLGRSQGLRFYALDDIMVVAGAYMGNYWDGDSADTHAHTHVWNGAAYTSTSTRFSKGTNGYQNVALDPGFETLNTLGFQGANTRTTVYRNRFQNPNFVKTVPADWTNVRSNYVTNPRVQSAITNYTVAAGTGGTAAIARATTAPLTGLPSTISAYARATWSVANTAAGTGYIQYGAAGLLGAFPNDKYQASAYVRDSLGQTKALQLVWLDSGGAVLSTTTGANSPADTNWNRIYVNGTVPASAASLVIRVVASGIRSASSTLDMTGVFLEWIEHINVPLQPYFDGAGGPADNAFSYIWAGTADSTNSVQTALKIASNFTLVPNGGALSTFQSTDGGQARLRLKAFQQNLGTGYADFDLGTLFTGHYEFRIDCAYLGTTLVGADHANRGTMQVIYKDAGGTVQTAVSAKAAVSTSFTTLSVSVDVPQIGGNFHVRLYHGGITGDPDLIFDNFAIVDAKLPAGQNPQFTGNSSAVGDLQYSWAGTAEASESLATYPGLSSIDPLPANSSQGYTMATTEWKSQGNYGLRMYNDAPRFTGANLCRWSAALVKPGQTYFIRAKVNLPQLLTGTTANTGKFGYTTTDSVIGYTWASTNFVNAVGTQTISTILTVDQDAMGNGLFFDWSCDPGQVVYMDELEVIHVPAGTVLADVSSLSQVTGFAQPANGYETAWAGAVNSSPSWLFAPMPYKASTPGAGAHVLQSADWSNPGSKSLRIRPILASSTNSYVDLDNGTGGLRLGFTPGAYYYIQARFRQSAAQTGTVNATSRLFQLIRTVGGSQVVTSSSIATNTVGEQVLSLTVQLEAGATDAFIRLWNGASKGNGDVYFDQILVMQINSATDVWTFGYFDGSSTAPDADFTPAWSGSPYVSTSLMNYKMVVNTQAEVRLFTAQSPSWAQGGGYSVRLIPTNTASNDSSYAPNGGGGAFRSGMAAGQTYTVRATRRLLSLLTGTLRTGAGQMGVFYTVGGVLQSTLTNVPLAIGTQDLSLTVTIPAGATDAYVQFIHGGYAGSGDLWFDNFMVVPVPDTSSPYTGIYFDGDSPYDTDLFPTWSGAQYTTSSILRGVKLNKISRTEAIQSGIAGNPSLRILPLSGQESYADLTATISGMLNSTSYLVRGTITLSQAQAGTPNSHARRIVVFWSTGELTPTYEQLVPNNAGTYDYVGIYSTPATGTLASIRAYNGDLYTGKSVTWDNFLIGQGLDQSVTFFSGDTPSAGGDFQYAWSGTANDSTSVMSATGVALAVSSATAAAIYAASWSSKGGHSLLVMPTSTSNNSFVSLGDPGGMRNGMIAGNSYTAQAKVRIDTAQTGTLNANARSILIGYKDSADGQYHYVQSNQAPNTPGVWFCRVSFTLPATATEAFIYLYNGASLGNGNVWWDEMLLVQVDGPTDPYLGDYFDGSTPDTDYADYGWTGTPDASTSTIKGVAATAPVAMTYRPAWL